MTKLKLNRKIYIIFLSVLILFVFFIIFISNKENKTLDSSTSLYSKNINTESAILKIGDTTTNLSFPANTLLYDTLIKEKTAGKIVFSGKNYPGLGFFVTDIGTLHTGNGKNLLYYINGKEATVGVSSYTLKNKDIIEWKLKWDKVKPCQKNEKYI